MRSGFADLNLPVSADDDVHSVRERLAEANRLGYSSVAATAAVSASTLCLGEVHTASRLLPAWPMGDAVVCASTAGAPAALRLRPLYQLTRLTVVLDEPEQLGPGGSKLRSAAALSYDLLAVSPTSDKAFAATCTSLPVDVISCDVSRRLPFRLRPQLVRAALARGLTFELCYAPCLRDVAARRQTFAGAAAVCRAVAAAGGCHTSLSISSGAARACELRGPADVANLAVTLFGLSKAGAARNCVSRNANSIIAHAAARRSAVKTCAVGLTSLAGGISSGIERAEKGWPPQATGFPPAAAGITARESGVADSLFLRV